LSKRHRREYIEAVQCLQGLPATSAFNGVKTRFDDFQALHIDQADDIHFVGHFLPWHRLFVSTYENTLQRECGYNGSNPYWDWTKDADHPNSFRQSPVFNSKTGFGGDGVNGSRCVTDGPFASYNISLGPGRALNNTCLTRTFNERLVVYITSKQVANATIQPAFERFWMELEGERVETKPHSAGHRSIGGVMGDVYSSPGDPLFYLHHANVDRIWWKWQMMDPHTRLHEISGRSTEKPPYTNVTLDFKLNGGTLAPMVPIRDVMNIMGPRLCYDYV